jgi:hypothetical protein
MNKIKVLLLVFLWSTFTLAMDETARFQSFYKEFLRSLSYSISFNTNNVTPPNSFSSFYTEFMRSQSYSISFNANNIK